MSKDFLDRECKIKGKKFNTTSSKNAEKCMARFKMLEL